MMEPASRGGCVTLRFLSLERLPNRYVLNYRTFGNIERRLRETGVEENILKRLEEDPGASVRDLSRQVGVSKDVVHRVIKEQLLRPYHIQTDLSRCMPITTENKLWASIRNAVQAVGNNVEVLQRA
ncbi:hypothetical protein ILUMI_26618 [Ignelater luminosus]|uniref:Uncharacterized protein n=1 Tax=Ignelater luminosus TaxID=2038154 RepID=A0A8K0FXB5_IGNLU|nr:hypothetical protein ILUMI_26618 [Ignelater luminosus]